MFRQLCTYILIFSLTLGIITPTQSKSENYLASLLAGSIITITGLGIGIYKQKKINGALLKNVGKLETSICNQKKANATLLKDAEELGTSICNQEKTNITLFQQLQYLKSGQEELKENELLLIAIENTLDNFNNFYSKELNLINNPSLLVEHLAQFDKDYIHEILRKIKSDCTLIENYSKQLPIKITLWQSKEGSKDLASLGRSLLRSMQALSLDMHKINKIIQANKDFLILNNYVYSLINQKYIKESEIIRSDHNHLPQLHNYIVTLYSSSAHQLPHLDYISSLQDTFNSMRALVDQFKSSKTSDNIALHTLTEDKAEQFINTLEKIQEAIVISDIYNQEKQNKPIFDREQKLVESRLEENQARMKREQQLVTAEIKEKEIQTQEEQQKNKILLQNELNKTDQLAHERKNRNYRRNKSSLIYKK